ncbi:inositol-3-phosphate synthase [Streptomyces wedmorensis]|uniref:inositol-3-phosphate synthase n=1 Tax=Streptomyces wedmorensis TaxID=43759 RepID=UPI003436BD7C
MTTSARVAVAGVGNNISALAQGIRYYADLSAQGVAPEDLPGIRLPVIGELAVHDVELVAAYDIDPRKIGVELNEAVFRAPNNYPRLGVDLAPTGVLVERGIVRDEPLEAEIARIAKSLEDSNAEVLLYSLPTGLQWAATAYAEAALAAGVAFVNCTPESVGRDEGIHDRYVAAGVPLIGDDLASHIGTSIVHRSLLRLFADRGITLNSSYQLNLGGNEDFRNLREQGASKRESKMNALAQDGVPLGRVDVIPSAGYVAHLEDHKVAYLNITGAGWANTPVEVDLKLRVQDSSNAAGVIIDLIRIAAAAARVGEKGFVAAAATLLKSPPKGHPAYSEHDVAASFEAISAIDS